MLGVEEQASDHLVQTRGGASSCERRGWGFATSVAAWWNKRMSGTPGPKVTIAELLPAMIELASIQHDLLQRLERSAAPPPVGPPLNRLATLGLRPEPVGVDMAKLILRSRQLIQWLLFRVDTAGE